jgi:IS4 transposase
MHIGKSKGRVEYRYVDAGWMAVSKLGTLHVIFSRKKQERAILGLVTDDPTLSAARIIQSYDRRWSIEVFFKETKQHLGLGQYQNGAYHAAVIHLHLVCFAYALLTHIAITGRCAQGTQQLKSAARLSTAQLQNELRRIVWEDMADYLRKLPNGDSVVKELTRLLIAA